MNDAYGVVDDAAVPARVAHRDAEWIGMTATRRRRQDNGALARVQPMWRHTAAWLRLPDVAAPSGIQPSKSNFGSSNSGLPRPVLVVEVRRGRRREEKNPEFEWVSGFVPVTLVHSLGSLLKRSQAPHRSAPGPS